MRLSSINIILFIILLSGLGVKAQVDFKASLNRSEIGKSERFKLSYTVNAEGEKFQPPELNNFRVLSGPNRSASMRVINFQRSVENTYSYVLMPKTSGIFSIGPASVQVEGKIYVSNSVRIKVTEQNPSSEDPSDPYTKAGQDAFFRVLSSKTTVYQGEPFVASYKLYFSTGVSRPEVVNEPAFTGFYKSPLDMNRITTRTESYRGKNYNTGVIRQLVLIPQQTGTIKPGTIDLRIPTEIATNRRDIFGRRMTRTVVQSVSRDFPKIKVLPLPVQGKPTGFSGAVGKYDIGVSVSRKELTADESLTLKVTISGTGNIKLIDAPKPEIPSAFELFDPKYSEKIKTNASGMSGSKTYEYLLIPRYEGIYKIPKINFSYFDPSRKRYVTITSKPIQVTVAGGKSQPEPQVKDGSPNFPGKETVSFINDDILFIKTDTSGLRVSGSNFLGSGSFYAWIIGLMALWVGLIGLYFFRRNRDSDQMLLKSRQAAKKARKHLSLAKKSLDSDDREQFYSALSTALWGYFSDKFHIPMSKMSKDVILEALKGKDLQPHLQEGIREIMNRAEMARYTDVGNNKPEDDYELAAKLLTEVENSL